MFTDKFRHFPEQMELVILGTTIAHFAIDALSLMIPAANLALFRNSLNYQRLLLEKYKERISSRAVILLTVVYPIFVTQETRRLTCPEAEIIYGKVLCGDDPAQPVSRQKIFQRHPEWYLRSPVFEQFIKDASENRYCSHITDKEAERRVYELIRFGWESCACPIHIWNYDCSFQTSERKARLMENVRCMERIIDYCREHGWRPVLVGLPYSERLNKIVLKAFLRDCFYQATDRIIKDTGIGFLDYSTDPEFGSLDNYMDIWFLNDRGRQKFKERLMQDLRNHGMFETGDMV